MKNERNYKVYMHTAPNNKKYIGITKTSVKRRWRNGKGYKTQRYFYFAIQKYGWDNFKHEILFCNLTKEQAELLEIAIIKHYKSNNAKCGYNIANGGHSQESVADSTRLKMRMAAVGRPSPRKGMFGIFPHKDETKIQISKTMKEKKINIGDKNPMYGKEAPNRRKVICIETEIIYESLKDSQEKTGIQFKNIHKVCNKERCTAGGFHWMFYEEYINFGINIKEDKSGQRKRKIMCIETQIIYCSIREAAKSLKICETSISCVLRNKTKTAGGYHWKYVD